MKTICRFLKIFFKQAISCLIYIKSRYDKYFLYKIKNIFYIKRPDPYLDFHSTSKNKKVED